LLAALDNGQRSPAQAARGRRAAAARAHDLSGFVRRIGGNRSPTSLPLESSRESGARMWRFHNRLRWALWGVALWLAVVIVALLVAQAF
jgi:hypothetical protein